MEDFFKDEDVDDDPYDLDVDVDEPEEPLNFDAEDWQDFEYDNKSSKSDIFFDDLSKVDFDQLPF